MAKLSPSGAHLWSTYLGGSDYDAGWGIAVDSAGNVLVTGNTRSSGWVSGGFDTSHNGPYDAFVAKLSPSGAHLWSTYLGGSNQDSGYGIAVDSAGNVLVAGYTESSGWVSGGFDTSYNGGGDAFVGKIHDSPAQGTARIVDVRVLTNGDVRLTVEVTGAAATNLVVESAGTLASPIPWGEEVSAVIATNAAGNFEAEMPVQGNARFYRMRLR